ncbi:MAG: hypothetical protein GX924_07270 [Clostridiaceae bacterium]|jgi:hypothetical protein|nr:hypothetical protein [Clostridiaceae bacterium]
MDDLSKEEKLRLADVEIGKAYRRAEMLHSQPNVPRGGLSEASNKNYFLEFVEVRKKILEKYDLTFEEFRNS